MDLARRRLLQMGGGVALAGLAPLAACSRRAQPPPAVRAGYTIRIAETKVELATGVEIVTTAYNGQVPGPLIRLQEGRPVVVDIENATGRPEQLHWHGQRLPVAVDGSQEEGTPYVPAHGARRIAFTPGPAGLRFYHSHVTAGSDLAAARSGRSISSRAGSRGATTARSS
jgi:FtsP/CotA-like multicopper oxidase with cupredoxin domain